MKAVLLATVVALLGVQLAACLFLRDGSQQETKEVAGSPPEQQYSCFPWIFNPGNLTSSFYLVEPTELIDAMLTYQWPVS